MPVQDERRGELRISLPLKLWFNVIGSADDFSRSQPMIPTNVEWDEKGSQLEGRDEVERFLMRMDRKLDFIISMLVENIGRKDYTHTGIMSNISESGLSIISPLDLPQGAFIEMGLILPNQPYKCIDASGEVVWVKDYDQSEETPDVDGVKLIGVSFIDIQSEDQDAIVHWIFQKQRENIRRQKEEENGY